MNTLFNLIVVAQVLSALAIIALVLMQHGKGADMGAAFGSGASGSLFGATGSSNFMSKSTAVAAAAGEQPQHRSGRRRDVEREGACAGHRFGCDSFGKPCSGPGCGGARTSANGSCACLQRTGRANSEVKPAILSLPLFFFLIWRN
jgi:protein translocase SecG subunit